MRISATLLAAAVLAAGASAQYDGWKFFQNWDASVEFTSRGANGGQADAMVSQAFQYGFAANLRTITMTQDTIQDQNAGTQETWNVGVCGLNAKALPDYGNVRNYITGLTMPIANGGRTFTATHSQLNSKPFKVTEDECTQWHHVWHFVPAANWATDGLGMHMSEGAPYPQTTPTRLCVSGQRRHREIPRVDVYSGTPAQHKEELAWSKSPSGADPQALQRAWFLYTWFGEAVLQGLSDNAPYNQQPCLNPNAGYASLDPNIDDLNSQQPPRFDDMVFELRAGSKFSGGVGVLFFATTVIPGGGVPTPFGPLHVNILGIPVGSVDVLAAVGPQTMPLIDNNGVSQFKLALGAGPSAIRTLAAELGTWHAQAAAISKQGEIQLSSLCTQRTRLVPPNFKHAVATQAKPVRLPTTAQPKIITVRNDGRGVLEVQARRAGAAFGPTTKICERSAVFVAIPAGSQEIEFRSPMNNNTAPNTETNFVYKL